MLFKAFFFYFEYVDFDENFFSERVLQIQFSMHVQNSEQNNEYFLPIKNNSTVKCSAILQVWLFDDNIKWFK